MLEAHILPVNDIDTHKTAANCKCCPEITKTASMRIVKHIAFDAREIEELESGMAADQKEWEVKYNE